MKKLLLVLGIGLLTFTICGNAATTNLGTITSTTDAIMNRNVTSGFTDTYTFSVPNNADTAISITNAFVGNEGKITNFSATLNGVALARIEDTIQQTLRGLFPNLAAGAVNTLVISGGGGIPNDVASYGGSIKIAIGQTPIPAAIWLFGSSLLGLVGIRRRKARV